MNSFLNPIMFEKKTIRNDWKNKNMKKETDMAFNREKKQIREFLLIEFFFGIHTCNV